MCEFISWKEVGEGKNKKVFFLTDDEVFSERGREMLEGSKDNDFLGHHAIDNIWGPACKDGKHREEKNFWEAGKLPKEIQSKLRDLTSFKKNFGRMIRSYAQRDDLLYIIRNAPKDDKKWTGLKEFCLEPLVEPLIKGVKIQKLAVSCRRDLSIKELVAAGKFDWSNPNVTDGHFPSEKGKAAKEEAVLVHCNQYVSDEELEAVYDHLKLRPGNPKELLSVAIDHPELQRKFPIVATGQICRGPYGLRYVPCVRHWDAGRELRLDCLADAWYDYFRFLAFRKF